MRARTSARTSGGEGGRARGDALPRLGAPVTLLADGASYPSRVEGSDGGDLLVAAPVDGPLARPGRALTTTWTSPRGRHDLPVALVAREPGAVPLWRVRASGPAVVLQRRRFVRVPVTLPVEVSWLAGAVLTAAATAADVGEGGLRLVLPGHVPDSIGTRLEVDLRLDARRVRAGARVAWSRRGAWRGEAGVAFVDLRARDADVVRRFVFAHDTAGRRSRGDG